MPISGTSTVAVDPVASLVAALTAAAADLSARHVTAGTGLTGGGTVASDPTLAVDFTVLGAIYAGLASAALTGTPTINGVQAATVDDATATALIFGG